MISCRWIVKRYDPTALHLPALQQPSRPRRLAHGVAVRPIVARLLRGAAAKLEEEVKRTKYETAAGTKEPPSRTNGRSDRDDLQKLRDWCDAHPEGQTALSAHWKGHNARKRAGSVALEIAMAVVGIGIFLVAFAVIALYHLSHLANAA